MFLPPPARLFCFVSEVSIGVGVFFGACFLFLLFPSCLGIVLWLDMERFIP